MVNLFEASSGRSGAMPLLRVRSKGNAYAVVQTDEPFSVGTHWLGRRLWCAGAECPACSVSDIREMVYFVVTAKVGNLWRPHLVEVTRHEFEAVTSATKFEGLQWAPGLGLILSRNKQRSPLRMDPVAAPATIEPSLGSVRIAIAAAAKVAGLPTPVLSETVDQFGRRVAKAARRLLEASLA